MHNGQIDAVVALVTVMDLPTRDPESFRVITGLVSLKASPILIGRHWLALNGDACCFTL